MRPFIGSVMAALVLGACVTASPQAGVGTTVPALSARPPVSCPTDPCAVVLVRFADPLDLSGVVSAAAQVGGAVVALWRTDSVCVPAVPARPRGPVVEALERSSFTYVDADVLAEAQNAGPPATTGGWAEALRARFVAEWDAARRPGVLFDGGAVLLPSPDVSVPGAERQVPVDAYLTDETSVLYLNGHFEAFDPLFASPGGGCPG